MCAISGIISKTDKTVSEEALKAMSNRMILRGPDESGLYNNGKIGLAHRRLAIIDTVTGQQPMSINNGDYVIVYNGEVYNFREIRSLLENNGCKFITESDTEVVINAYIYYGLEKCLKATFLLSRQRLFLFCFRVKSFQTYVEEILNRQNRS